MNETAAPPRTIFIIRHGEKHGEPPPPHGVTVEGRTNDHSLRPRRLAAGRRPRRAVRALRGLPAAAGS